MGLREALRGGVLAVAWLTAGMAGCAGGGEPGGDIHVEGAWVRAVSAPEAGGPVHTAAYMTIVNMGSVTDSLVGAHTPVARLATIQRTRIDEDGLATMGPAGAVEIPAGASLILEPGALHVMLMEVRDSLLPADTVDVVLRFASGREVKSRAAVRAF